MVGSLARAGLPRARWRGSAPRTRPWSRPGAARRTPGARCARPPRARATTSGPGVGTSAFGERLFGPLVAGKKAQLNGSATQPHSVAYIEDVAAAAAVLGTRDEALGEAWIAPDAPATTQVRIVEEACRILGVAPSTTVLPPLLMRLAGMLVPAAPWRSPSREMVTVAGALGQRSHRLRDLRFGHGPRISRVPSETLRRFDEASLRSTLREHEALTTAIHLERGVLRPMTGAEIAAPSRERTT